MARTCFEQAASKRRERLLPLEGCCHFFRFRPSRLAGRALVGRDENKFLRRFEAALSLPFAGGNLGQHLGEVESGVLVLTVRFLPNGPPACRCPLEARGDLRESWGGAAGRCAMFGFGAFKTLPAFQAGFLTPGRFPDAEEGGLQVDRLLVLDSKGLSDLAGESEKALPVPRGLLRGERGSWGAEDCSCCPFPVDASLLLRLKESGLLGVACFFMISSNSRKARR